MDRQGSMFVAGLESDAALIRAGEGAWNVVALRTSEGVWWSGNLLDWKILLRVDLGRTYGTQAALVDYLLGHSADVIAAAEPYGGQPETFPYLTGRLPQASDADRVDS